PVPLTSGTSTSSAAPSPTPRPDDTRAELAAAVQAPRLDGRGRPGGAVALAPPGRLGSHSANQPEPVGAPPPRRGPGPPRFDQRRPPPRRGRPPPPPPPARRPGADGPTPHNSPELAPAR